MSSWCVRVNKIVFARCKYANRLCDEARVLFQKTTDE